MSEHRIERGRGASLRADARAVREAVFVEEQGVDPELEYDDHDATALHFVGYAGEDPVAAARLRTADDGVGKVERVAVRESRRGRGWGRRLMVAVHDAARDEGYERLRLHAQTHVRGFYEALGYEAVSDTFTEAGIPHVAMVRRL
ncbi:MAG: GNAT family N-acetyltransferase [Halobacteriaceae archaeon]